MISTISIRIVMNLQINPLRRVFQRSGQGNGAFAQYLLGFAVSLKVVHPKGTDKLNLYKYGLSRAESLLISVTGEVKSSAHTADKLGTPHGFNKGLDRQF